ncbi:uncharacterized protein A4U43_C08F2690 [Asparagus officinalis]|nr:uncharacterized protein A4U43_C08F2690 [Asparagus officinalis]
MLCWLQLMNFVGDEDEGLWADVEGDDWAVFFGEVADDGLDLSGGAAEPEEVADDGECRWARREPAGVEVDQEEVEDGGDEDGEDDEEIELHRLLVCLFVCGRENWILFAFEWTDFVRSSSVKNVVCYISSRGARLYSSQHRIWILFTTKLIIDYLVDGYDII